MNISEYLIDPYWLAEFRGFFYGEGYLGITSWGKHPKGYTKLMARAQITCRSDDDAILYDIADKLGGVVYVENDGRRSSDANGDKVYQSNPYTVWRVTKAADIACICDILEAGLLPSKKKDEVAIIREFLATVKAPGKRLSPKDYRLREKLWKQIKELHQFNGGA